MILTAYALVPSSAVEHALGDGEMRLLPLLGIEVITGSLTMPMYRTRPSY